MKRTPSTKYDGNDKCSYCNEHTATHTLVNGKLCCASTAGNCKKIRKSVGVKISISRNSIDPSTGQLRSKIIADKIAENKRNNIDENGLDMHQRGALNSAKSKREDIDENGLNAHQRNGINFSNWCFSTESGTEYRRQHGERQRARMQNGEAIRRSKLSVETRLNDVDENGVNGFDRAHLKSKNCGFIDGVFYQSSNEKRFLENAKNLGITDVKRGPGFKYMFEENERTYLSDYVIGNSLYEVKSNYTWHGVDNCYLEMNIAKLEAAKKAGYSCYVVIDDQIVHFDSAFVEESRRLNPYKSRTIRNETKDKKTRDDESH